MKRIKRLDAQEINHLDILEYLKIRDYAIYKQKNDTFIKMQDATLSIDMFDIVEPSEVFLDFKKFIKKLSLKPEKIK